jgi:hypothetical protein
MQLNLYGKPKLGIPRCVPCPKLSKTCESETILQNNCMLF